MDALAASSASTRPRCGGGTSSADVPAHDRGRPDVDSGNYERALDRALELVGYDELRAEQRRRRRAAGGRSSSASASPPTSRCAASRRRGVLAALELLGAAAGTPRRCACTRPARSRCHRHLAARPGPRDRRGRRSSPTELGVPIEDVEVLHGDTAFAPLGLGHLRRRARWPSAARRCARRCEKVKDKARHDRRPRARVLESTTSSSSTGAFTRQGHARSRRRRSRSSAFAAWAAHDLPDGMEPGLEATDLLRPAELHVPVRHARLRGRGRPRDRAASRSCNYVAVDDCGNVINPMIVDGPGARRHRPGRSPRRCSRRPSTTTTASCCTASLIDYLMPSAAELPSIELDRTVTPSPTNPLGVKGIGEAGTIAATAGGHQRGRRRAVAARHPPSDMPMQPHRVWDGHPDREPGGRRVIPLALDYTSAALARRGAALLVRDGAKPIAGGQSLVPMMRLRLASPDALVDLGGPRRADRHPRRTAARS